MNYVSFTSCSHTASPHIALISSVASAVGFNACNSTTSQYEQSRVTMNMLVCVCVVYFLLCMTKYVIHVMFQLMCRLCQCRDMFTNEYLLDEMSDDTNRCLSFISNVPMFVTAFHLLSMCRHRTDSRENVMYVKQAAIYLLLPNSTSHNIDKTFVE
jgi:hypothetical protein